MNNDLDQYIFYAGVSNKANGAMTSFPYNVEYWQNWKLLVCQHTSPDEMWTEQQAPNTNVEQKTSPNGMEIERQAPKKNAGQTTSLFWKAPNKNAGQKTLLFHNDGEHSIDVLTQSFIQLRQTNWIREWWCSNNESREWYYRAKIENEGYKIAVPVNININIIDIKAHKGRDNIDIIFRKRNKRKYNDVFGESNKRRCKDVVDVLNN